jgi:hypothetical protein
MQKNGRESINLADFDVKRFEFKTELDTSMAPAFKPIRIVPELVIPQALAKSEKPQEKPTSEPLLFNTSGSGTATERAPEAGAPEAIQPVRVVIEPPPPPPVARQVSMDIGDAESQVRVVIRERNGELDLRFEAGSEDLRRELESSSPGLLNELQRDGARGVTLDFTSFGSATDADRQQQQQNRSKKQLKPDAVFADLNETAYSADESSSPKSL